MARPDVCDWLDLIPPDWSLATIRSLNADMPPEAFCISKRTVIGDVDVQKIVGQREHYAGYSWAAALSHYGSAKMARNLRELADFGSDYYFSELDKQDISVCTWDGMNWYTDGDGNHRVVIAKFLFHYRANCHENYPLLRRVRTSYVDVDFLAWDFYQKLLRPLPDAFPSLHFSLYSSPVARFEGGEYIEQYRGQVFVHDMRRWHEVSRYLTLEEFKLLATHLLYPTWRDRLFSLTEWIRRLVGCRPRLFPADSVSIKEHCRC